MRRNIMKKKFFTLSNAAFAGESLFSFLVLKNGIFINPP